MTDTNHIEVLRAVRSVFDHIPEPCEERAALDAAITALSARASAEDAGDFASDTAALAFLRLVGNGNPNIERAVKRLHSSLIARASAGEGGESEPPKYHCQNGSGHVCLAASLRPGNVVCPHDECDIDTGVFEMPTAAPQPAQAGASGGGKLLGWAKAASDGQPMLHTATESVEQRDAWVLNGWTAVPLYTTPASPATGEDFEAWFAKQDSRTEWRELVRLAYYATPQPESAGEWDSFDERAGTRRGA